MEKKEVINKFQYVGKGHTFVRINEKSDKVRVESGEIFESTRDPKKFRSFFVRLGTNTPTVKVEDNTNVTQIKEDDTLDVVEATKLYVEKFGENPDKRWWVKTILSKLQ